MKNKEIRRTEIEELGEFGLIRHLTSSFPNVRPSTKKGIGDDAAVFDHGERQSLVSTDLLLEGIHFDLMYFPLKHLGYKSIVVNLSDIYAMNARPEQITVSIGMSNRFSVEALEELFLGMKTACEEYGVDLVGGDTSSSLQGLVISITAIGTAPADEIVYRSGAQVGDMLCVSGDLGAAYLGLQLLEREKRLFQENPEIKPDLEGQDYIVGRQLKPEARRDIYEFFAQTGLKPTSMIDLSDGLSSDLMHICRASQVGAMVEEAELPIFDETRELAFKFQLDPSMCALNGGEDYELLFTVDPKDLGLLKEVDEGITIIGEIRELDYGLQLKSKKGQFHELKAQGWRHFSDDSTV